MTPQPRNHPQNFAWALPLAVLALAAWNALPTLAAAWSNDLYARGAALAFAIWLAPQALLLVKNRRQTTEPGLIWLVLSLVLCAAGSMSGLRVLLHLSLAVALPGLLGLRWTGLITSAGAIAWLPASGWFLSHLTSGGLRGWERPTYAALLALILLALTLVVPKPSPTSNSSL